MAEAKKKEYPKSEWTEERLQNMIDDGINQVKNSVGWTKYLKTMSQFHRYSFNNLMLIMLQKPDASLVAGYVDWTKKFKRQVKRGAKAIHILRPNPKNFTVKTEDEDGKETEKIVKKMFFKPCSVFDISDTEGEEIPTICNELKGTVEEYEKLFQAMMDISICPVEFEDIKNGAKGYYNKAEDRIAIQEGMSQIQNCKTICHEMTHSRLHKDSDLDRNTKETEAESVAFVVCNHFGIDTSDYSFEYLASWSSAENKELKASIKRISETAKEMIDLIESKLEIKEAV